MDKLKARYIGGSTALGFAVFMIMLGVVVAFQWSSMDGEMHAFVRSNLIKIIFANVSFGAISWMFGAWIGELILIKKINAYLLGVVSVFVILLTGVYIAVLGVTFGGGQLWDHQPVLSRMLIGFIWTFLGLLSSGTMPSIILGLLFGFIVQRRGKKKSFHHG
ncbi:MAG: hypothetical protein IIA45_02075 [Bacteroidetes bacterium]|nr:hypothetical protein [Bacteroidota bacterium]